MKTTIWKRWSLACAHYLPHVNAEHKCRRVHGHNLVVEVHISGKINTSGEDQGMVIDFDYLDSIWAKINERLDHRLLNDVPGLDNPTSENISQWIWGMFSAWLPAQVMVCRVVVQENDHSGACLEET